MKRLTILVCTVVCLALASGCGDSDNTTIILGDDLDPAPGTFTGSTTNGGAVVIIVGSIDRIDLACGSETIVGDCSPPVEIGPDGAVQDSCGDVSFDLRFATGGNSVSGSVSGGTSCDGNLANVIREGGSNPTPAATPTQGQPTTVGTQTPGPQDPTPTPTEGDGGGPSCSSPTIVVGVSVDSQGVNLAGAAIQLGYPTSSVEIPGSIDAPTVRERVTFLVDAPFQVVNDQDTPPEDGMDDTLNISATGVTPFAPGAFADIEFDCIGSEPTAGQFTCHGNASDEFGGDVAITCSVTVQ